MVYKIDVYDGKYTFINDNGRVSILRYGKAWRIESGDGAILALIQETEKLRDSLQRACNSLGADVEDYL